MFHVEQLCQDGERAYVSFPESASNPSSPSLCSMLSSGYSARPNPLLICRFHISDITQSRPLPAIRQLSARTRIQSVDESVPESASLRFISISHFTGGLRLRANTIIAPESLHSIELRRNCPTLLTRFDLRGRLNVTRAMKLRNAEKFLEAWELDVATSWFVISSAAKNLCSQAHRPPSNG
jgi:hypothetical protein